MHFGRWRPVPETRACTACGTTYPVTQPARQGPLCPRCAARARDARRKQRRVSGGLCGRCGQPASPGRVTCEACVADRIGRRRQSDSR